MADIVLLAHRGSNPYPDHSREAYVWAVNWGADFIEPDLYLTKDGVLVSSHDNHNYQNLTYAEAKLAEPALMTFDEVIELAKAMSIETGREIGIIPETKSTDYATSAALVAALVAHGFTDPDRVVIQSFSSGNLQQLHDTIMPEYGVDIPLALLGSGISNPDQIAGFADIVAPSFGSFSAADVAAAHAAGLEVTAWTILGAQSDIQKLIDMGVDAVFVDDTRLARTAIEAIAGAGTVYGTPQWDVLAGSAGADTIYAMQGDDIVRAGAGDDHLYGDGGADLLFGGAGDDRLYGGAGNDFLAGGDGADTLAGGAGNDVLVATGDSVLFAAGGGIDLVALDGASTILFEDIASTAVTVLQSGDDLILRAGDDALVIRGGGAAGKPASITFADGVTLTGEELLSRAQTGSDAAIAAVLPGLEQVLAAAPALAEPSTVALGTDLVMASDFGEGVLARTIADVETGAVYRLAFTLTDLTVGADGVRVTWGGATVYEGTPEATGSVLEFFVVGGSGDGSNELAFSGPTGPESFGAALDAVHLVKVAEPALPLAGNSAPEAADADLLVSRDFVHTGRVGAADADGDVLVYILGEGPAHGTLDFASDGTYRYTPEAGYTGADRFTFLVNDGHGGLDQGVVGLTVAPGVVLGTDLIVNGSFEDLSGSTGNNGPSDWGYRNANGTIVGWTDLNGNRIEQHWDSPNGVAAVDGRIWLDMDGYNTNTHIVQDVEGVEEGATYRLSFSIADADTAVSDDGIRVLWGGRVVYEGVASNPWQTFTFRVTGGAGDGSDRLEFIALGTGLNTYGAALDDVSLVKIAEPGESLADNAAPEAAIGNGRGGAGAVIAGQLAATDPDGDAPLVFALGTAAVHGAVTVDADGRYRYTPAEGYVGTDSFTFTVSDGRGGVDSAVVSLTVEPADLGKDLIVNGGFEDLTGANNSASWGYRNTSPAGVFAGWTNAGDTRAEVHKDTVGGVGAAAGTYWFDMEGAPNNAKLVQTVADVVTGGTYRLTFSIADTDTAQAADTIAVYWGGALVYTGVPKGIWQTISVDVIGGAGDGSNELVFESKTANPNGAGVALDAVSLVRIAENPNLIVNGGFEDLTGAADGSFTGDWGYRNVNGVIAGWQQVNTAEGGRAELHFDTQNGVSAQSGKVWFDMDGDGNNAELVQTVSGVEDGATYRLRFFIADADARTDDDGVRVLWGGEVVYEGVPSGGWHEVIVDVIGGAGDGSNTLTFKGTESDLNGYGAALDEVSLRKIADAPVNTAPLATDDAGLETAHATPLVIEVARLLANDSDAEGDPLIVLSVQDAVGGTVALDEHGAIVFTPADDFAGDARFDYTVSDGRGGVGTASVAIVVAPAPNAGDDEITGGNGDETLDGEAGDDVVKGGAGNDAVTGGTGDDTVDGGSGDDVVEGGAGTDTVRGGSGGDTARGGAGDDAIDGGSGDDLLFGDAGRDTIAGGSGDDTLDGGADDDVLSGGSGHDVFVFAAGFGHDRVTDFSLSGSSADVIAFADDLFADFAAVLGAADQVGRDVVITIDDATSLTLANVKLAALAADDFRFA